MSSPTIFIPTFTATNTTDVERVERNDVHVILGSIRYLKNLERTAVADPDERSAHEQMVRHARRRIVELLCCLLGLNIDELHDLVVEATTDVD